MVRSLHSMARPSVEVHITVVLETKRTGMEIPLCSFYCNWRLIFNPCLPDFNSKYHLKGTAFLHITAGHDKNNSGKPPEKVKAPWPSLLNSEGKLCMSPGKCFWYPLLPIKLPFSCLMSASCSCCPCVNGAFCLSYLLGHDVITPFPAVGYIRPEYSTISVYFIIACVS